MCLEVPKSAVAYTIVLQPNGLEVDAPVLRAHARPSQWKTACNGKLKGDETRFIGIRIQSINMEASSLHSLLIEGVVRREVCYFFLNAEPLHS